MSISSEELNRLIYIYFIESGFEHTAYCLKNEARVILEENWRDSELGLATLIKIIQKGMQMMDVETHISEDGSINKCLNPYGLNHACNIPTAKRIRNKKLPEKKIRKTTANSRIEKNYEDNEEASENDKEAHTPLSQDDRVDPKVSEKINGKFVPGDITMFTNHKSEVYFGKFNPLESNILASGSNDGTVRITNILTKKDKILTHVANVGEDLDITSMEWSTNGDFLCTTTFDGNMRLWDVDGKLLHDMKFATSPLLAVKWRPRQVNNEDKRQNVSPFNDSNDWIATCGFDGSNKVWSPQTPNKKYTIQYHKEVTTDLDWLDSNVFATSSTDKSISVVDLRSSFSDQDKTNFKGNGRPVLVWKDHKAEINCVKWHPSSELAILASGSDDKTVKIWKLNHDYIYPSENKKSSKISTRSILSLENHDDQVLTLKWSPLYGLNSNSILATSSSDKTVKLWDLNSKLTNSILETTNTAIEPIILNSPKIQFNRHRNAVYCLDFSNDGRYIATGGFDNNVYVWSTTNGKLIRTFRGNGGVFDLHWSTLDANKLLATMSNHSVVVFDLRS